MLSQPFQRMGPDKVPLAQLHWFWQPPGSARSSGVGALLGLRVSSCAVPVQPCSSHSTRPLRNRGTS